LKSSFPEAEAFFKDLYEKFVGSKGATAATNETMPIPDPIS
jgi:hypothetical protein